MCGIVGVIARHKIGLLGQHLTCFDQLLYIDALRGEDSTGLIGVGRDTSFHIAKEASEATYFLYGYSKEKARSELVRDGKAVIGHNRKKTYGEINDENAHPFVVNGEFAMVHNGTLRNHEKLAKTNVDSEALAIHLHKAFENDADTAAIEKALGEVEGAYAVAMYDQRVNKVRLLRNDERPLCYVQCNNAWFFASEAASLWWIMSRNGYDQKDWETKWLAPHSLIEFDLDLDSVEERKLTVKKYTPPSNTANTSGGTTKGPIIKYSKITNISGLSKNEFKRLRKQYLGLSVEFFVDDWVETNFPRTLAEGETMVTLMGTSDVIKYSHNIIAPFDTTYLDHEIEDCIRTIWRGRVEELEYNPKTRSMVIQIANAVMIPSSKPTKKKEHLPVLVVNNEEPANATPPTLH